MITFCRTTNLSSVSIGYEIENFWRFEKLLRFEKFTVQHMLKVPSAQSVRRMSLAFYLGISEKETFVELRSTT